MTEDINSVSSSEVSDSNKVLPYEVVNTTMNETINDLHTVHSITFGLTRVTTFSSHVSKSIRSLINQVRDENEQTDSNVKELQKTEIGRMLTNLEFDDAIRLQESRIGDNLTKETENDMKSNVENVHIEDSVKSETDNSKLPPQDAGYAWVICLSITVMLMATWGATTSFGIYISYWLNNDYYNGADAVDYALSTSIVLFLAQALAPLAVLTSNIFGLRQTMLFGTVIHTSGFIALSFAKSLPALYLTQGLTIGFGFAFIFNPAMVILASWFSKYRAFASGISIAGAGCGGMIFTLAGQNLIDRTGDTAWAIRMVGITVFVLNFSVSLAMKERIPKQRERSVAFLKKQCATILNWQVLKLKSFWLITFWFGLAIISFIVITYSLASYATFIGLTTRTGAHLTAIFNGCQAIGRPFLGLSGDKFGRINLALCLNVVVGILVLGFWINCTEFVSLLFFAIISGFVTGWAQVLNQAILPDAIPIQLFPSAWSFQNMILGSFCLLSEVVALKLRQPGAQRPFLYAQLFAGVLVFVSLSFLIPVRELKIKKIIKDRLSQTEKELNILNYDNESLATKETQFSCFSDETQRDISILLERKERYQTLLVKGRKGYFARLFYPMKA